MVKPRLQQSVPRFTPRLTQPPSMRTKSYIYGVQPVDGNDGWALFQASAVGDVSTARALLKKDARLVNVQYWYRFPIHLALFAGHTQIVKLLLDHGADPGQSVYTYDSWNKLLRYARERGYSEIESLLERAMQQRFNYSPDFEPLQQAIIAGDSRKISATLRRLPHLREASDALGNNALHWSVLTRQPALMQRFVELGTPIDARRADGQTPLLLAANGAGDYWYRAARGPAHPSLRNTFVLVGSLLALGANYTISVAAACGDQQRVEQLLRKNPALATELDSARISPLSYAARHGYLHIVKLLLEYRANPNTPEDAAPQGRALFEACCGNHLEVARVLLEHGANPNAGTDSNECCLTIGTIYHGDRAQPLVKLLTDYGALKPPYRMSTTELRQAMRENQPVTRDGDFFSSVLARHNRELLELYLDSQQPALEDIQLHSAVASTKSLALVRTLLDRGLDPNQPDWLGVTLLHACAEHGNRRVAAALLDAGADINARDVEYQGTPLAAAVRACCQQGDADNRQRLEKMIKFLLGRGAATNLPGDQGWATPLAWATRHGRSDLAQLLRHYGA